MWLRLGDEVAEKRLLRDILHLWGRFEVIFCCWMLWCNHRLKSSPSMYYGPTCTVPFLIIGLTKTEMRSTLYKMLLLCLVTLQHNGLQVSYKISTLATGQKLVESTLFSRHFIKKFQRDDFESMWKTDLNLQRVIKVRGFHPTFTSIQCHGDVLNSRPLRTLPNYN